MSATITGPVIAEVRCVNCGRTLAALSRDASGHTGLRRAPYQAEMLVRVERGRVLRCLRCEGRAFIEPCDELAPAAGLPSVALCGAA